MKSPRHTMVSLFSGAGGMDLGLEQAGFEVLATVEKDEQARLTLHRNRPSWMQWGNGDVHEAVADLTPRALGIDLGQLDLLAGAPPCQPFSAAARWASSGVRGMADERADTLKSMMQLVETFLPRAVLFENVRGFYDGANSAQGYLSDRFAEINHKNGTQYALNYRVIDAVEVGVPQHRKRAILVALRDDVEWSWNVNSLERKPVTAGAALLGLPGHSKPSAKGKWAGLLPSIPNGENYQWLTARGGGAEVFGYRTRYWNFLLKLSPDLPSWTLAASPGPSTGPFHWENRPLSALEAQRLQTFPLDWDFPGAYRAQMKLIGNATPPLLAERVGRDIVKALAGESGVSAAPLVLSIQQVDHKAALRSSVQPLPAEFLHLVGHKSAHAGAGRGPAPRPRSGAEGVSR